MASYGGQVPPTPAEYKPLQHYLKIAMEHDHREPVIAYYCRLYSLQQGMKIERKAKHCVAFLTSLMDVLEKMKKDMRENEAISSELVGQAHVEQYALKMFMFADSEDRAGSFSKNVVKSFYTAGMLFDVLTNFAEGGELSEEDEHHRKYAKWKAAYIHNCLKSGEQPIAGPFGEEFGADFQVSDPSSRAGAPGPADAGPPPDDVHDVPPVPKPRSQAPEGTFPPAEQAAPPSSSGSVYSAETFQEANKYCKYASSALQYEDASTAIDYLQKALKLLQTSR